MAIQSDGAWWLSVASVRRTAKCPDSVFPTLDTHAAPTGRVFIAVGVKVTTTGDAFATVSSSEFRLLDAAGRPYAVSESCAFADDGLTGDTLYADSAVLPATGILYFAVPAAVRHFGLVWTSANHVWTNFPSAVQWSLK